MNALVAGEFEKLTPHQKARYHELVAWQTAGNKGQGIMSDAALFKVIEWVKKIPEPEQIVKKEE